MVGLLLPKQVVAGSSPVYRSKGVAPNARRAMPASSLASIVDWRPAGRMPFPIADHASEMVSTEGSRSGRLSPRCSQPVRTSLEPPSAFGKKLGTAPVAGTVDALGSNPSSIRWSVGANPTRGTVSPKCQQRLTAWPASRRAGSHRERLSGPSRCLKPAARPRSRR